jgi:hypothetical protein
MSRDISGYGMRKIIKIYIAGFDTSSWVSSIPIGRLNDTETIGNYLRQLKLYSAHIEFATQLYIEYENTTFPHHNSIAGSVNHHAETKVRADP